MSRKNKGKLSQCQEKSEENSTRRDSGDANNEHEAMDNLQASIGAIHKEIRAIRSDVKEELDSFRDNFSKDMKSDLASLREDVNGKLNEIVSDLKETRDRAEEATQRVADMEEWTAAAKEVLSQTLKNQDQMQAKLTDLESCLRRNNIRIYGIPEDTEGSNLQDFIESFIKTELQLQDTDLYIQRCHRAFGPKPPQNASPRSVVVYFLENRTKELVLRSAWKKKEIRHDQQRVYFDQDYPAEIQKKRRCYAPIRKLLKEKGLRFQTPPPAKLRVFFDSGTVIYNSASEAMEDLTKRGLAPAVITKEVPAAPAAAAAAPPTEMLERLSWNTVDAKRRNTDAYGDRARKKLTGFRHDKSDTVSTPK